MLRRSIDSSGAQIESDELPTVWGDRTQLTSLFQNLLGNALKYRKPDEPPRIQITVQPDESGTQPWQIAIRDNGIGIRADHLEQIFQIFRRLHTDKTYPGTGIGLALCRRIVERHGGRIWVESEGDKGSAFFFTLPREAPDDLPDGDESA